MSVVANAAHRDEDLAEIMPAVDQITLTLQKIVRRKEREQAKKLVI
jgi:hypothetical protein